VSRQKLEKKNA